ncbi:bile acid acyltransferase/acyl-CoA thioester hydrolase-like protein [Pseudonocardia alni]|uniref:Bile acid acyltransferase/acyl-CoA thioester hydrolase-like protein n=1 Tax=Pseudonocardia alni TaxID=33907 RepID=A0AA44UV19_PSEA5|nr:bile acid acyltransferase/acyl-CoA thioester hydrolase-like protein [Pseudonocardia alni]
MMPAYGRRRRVSSIGVLVGALAVVAAALPAETTGSMVTRTAGINGESRPVSAAAVARVAGPLDDLGAPDPLMSDSGERITSARAWEQQRPELLAAFEENVYGTSLPAPTKTTFSEAGGGGGSAKKITITVTGPEGDASFTLRLFTPSSGTPKGTFLLIDHRGSVGDDPGSGGYAPAATITGAGYALAAVNAEEIAPDDASSYRNGVIDAFYPAGQDLPADAGRTISAWAWGASRAMDYLQTDPDIDPSKVAVIGHSRGGKAALWAGAQDPRFPVVISNNSGSTGAKLARRDSAGESISAINSQFPHWFPETYKRYDSNADALPVDQNELLALIAPGRVVVASAAEDGNADPQGEFLSYLGAAPVYELYGLGDTGLSSTSWPPATGEGFRGPGMSYHLRSGGHGLEDADWDIYLGSDLFTR